MKVNFRILGESFLIVKIEGTSQFDAFTNLVPYVRMKY